MNIIENDSGRFLIFLQLIILGILNLITLKKIEGLNTKVEEALKEFKNQKL